MMRLMAYAVLATWTKGLCIEDDQAAASSEERAHDDLPCDSAVLGSRLCCAYE